MAEAKDKNTADEDLDLDTEKGGKKSKTLLIIIIVVLLLAAGGGAAAFFLLGGDKKDTAKGEQGEGGEQVEIVIPPAIYMSLKPTFVVNFEQEGDVRFLQVDIEIMSRHQDALDVVETHLPLIRNNFILILSAQEYKEINKPAGKEKLRQQLLESINGTISNEIAAVQSKEEASAKEPDNEKYHVQAVYFTSFVMQ